MKRNYQRFCDWVFIRSPSLMLRNAISGGCKYGYKGFGRLCRSCENCIEPISESIFETKEEGGIHVAGGLRYQSGREMPPGMQELYGVQLAEQISKAPRWRVPVNPITFHAMQKRKTFRGVPSVEANPSL